MSSKCCVNEAIVKGAFKIKKDLSISNIPEDKKYAIFYPNSFSPNGDGINDKFNVVGKNLNLKSVVFYNDEKEKIKEYLSPFNGWDGTVDSIPVAEGKYGYDFLFTNESNDELHFYGTLCLWRSVNENCEECIYPDEIDSLNGVVLTSNEPLCTK